MKVIYKYEITEAHTNLYLPPFAKILQFGLKEDGFFIWAMHTKPEIGDPTEYRQFRIVCTGEEFDDKQMEYIGTTQRGFFVFHLFELK